MTPKGTTPIPGSDTFESVKPAATSQVPIAVNRDAPTRPIPSTGDNVAQLTILVGPDAGRLYRVESEGLIGRGTDVSVRIASADISRRHAAIRCNKGGQFYVEDLGSRNGTRVNGVPVKEQALQPGDKIMVGASTILMFTRQDGLEDQLLQLQKMESLGQLAGGVAHDFNNLLGAVLANTSFLKSSDADTTLGNADVRESIEDIEMAAKRAVDLVKQLMGFARRGKFEDAITNLSDITEEVSQLLRRTFKDAIKLQVSVDPELYVMGDKTQLHQMLVNLCINARDAMPQGGRLVLEGTSLEHEDIDSVTQTFLRPGAHVAISVRDTGMGMDRDTCRRVFDPFFTTKEQGKGIGLGLAMVYGIVKNHGGHVEVKSELERGTTFRVYLPKTDDGGADPDVEFPAEGTQKRLRKAVLLVDDDPALRAVTESMLKALGYPVLCAANGKEGLRLYLRHQENIDLVLLDMRMPGLDGGETFLELKRVDPRVKVVLVSGMADEKQVRWLLSAGALEFLPKPYDAEALTRVINRINLRSRPTVTVEDPDDPTVF